MALFAGLFQAWFWFDFASQNHDRPIPGMQWTLFAWCWRISQQNFGIEIFNGMLSLLLVATALLPVDRRRRVYQFYIAAVICTLVLPAVAYQYLVTQLPGNWGSMITHNGSDASQELGVFLLLGHPALFGFLVRMLYPGQALEL